MDVHLLGCSNDSQAAAGHVNVASLIPPDVLEIEAIETQSKSAQQYKEDYH
jgi:hypothetical protein